jgi:hypothetical protein
MMERREPPTAAPSEGPRDSENAASAGAQANRPHGARHPLIVASLVTLAVTAVSYLAPGDYAATAVGGAFIVAVVRLVLRFDTATIRHFGLSLGGVLEPTP